MEKKYTIYALSDPAFPTSIRYVGATTQLLSNRKGQIKYAATRGQFEEVGSWIRQVEDLGRKVTIISLEIDPTDGMEAERRWIAIMRAAGHDLFNKADGGRANDGWNHTDDWKVNNSRLITGMKRSDETRAKISAAKLGKPRPDLAARNKENGRLSPEDVASIKALVDAGVKMRDIGLQYGISAGMVCMIKAGKRYNS